MRELVALLALTTVAFQPAMQARNAKAIAAAKRVSVHQLDSTLPKKPFMDWLNAVVGANAERTWDVNDCGEQTGSPGGADFPICAEVEVALPGKRRLFVSLSVGTHQTGVATDRPEFWWAIVVEPDGSQKWPKRLSEVPASIRSLK